MYKATITYTDGRIHFVTAGTIELLKSKCNPFIKEQGTETISVDKIESLGYLKHPTEQFIFLPRQ